MKPEDAKKTAVALTYEAGASAPRVVAKGRGLIAQEIIERAAQAGVYVHESPELVALLMQVELDEAIPQQLDEAIPQQLYVAVAELLAWLYRLDTAAGPDAPLLPSATTVRARD